MINYNLPVIVFLPNRHATLKIIAATAGVKPRNIELKVTT